MYALYPIDIYMILNFYLVDTFILSVLARNDTIINNQIKMAQKNILLFIVLLMLLGTRFYLLYMFTNYTEAFTVSI